MMRIVIITKKKIKKLKLNDLISDLTTNSTLLMLKSMKKEKEYQPNHQCKPELSLSIPSFTILHSNTPPILVRQ
jgi:hypothetical protein